MTSTSFESLTHTARHCMTPSHSHSRIFMLLSIFFSLLISSPNSTKPHQVPAPGSYNPLVLSSIASRVTRPSTPSSPNSGANTSLNKKTQFSPQQSSPKKSNQTMLFAGVEEGMRMWYELMMPLSSLPFFALPSHARD